MAGLNVLVVGASVAGPATAYWMAKAGAKVTVIERFPELRAGGQAVDIRTAGVAAMREMDGMEDLVRSKSTQQEGASFVRSNGRPYGTLKTSGNSDQQSIVSEYEIFRGDLAKILFNLSQEFEDVAYHFNEQISSMSSDGPNGLTVEFTDALPTKSYDLVVACDGAASRTRAMAFACGQRQHTVPLNCWMAFFTTKHDFLDGSQISQAYSVPGGRTINITPDPSGHSKVVMTGMYPRSQSDAIAPFRQALKDGSDAAKEYVAEYYRDAGWKTEALLREMHDAKDFYASELVQIKMPTLQSQNGHCVLVGDAGYAAGLTGGGTSLALTGAYILTGEVSKQPDNLIAALTAYEQQMRPIIDEMQKVPPLIGTILAPQTAWGIWIRDHIFAFVCWIGIVDFLQRNLGAAFADTKAFPLPHYERLNVQRTD